MTTDVWTNPHLSGKCGIDEAHSDSDHVVAELSRVSDTLSDHGRRLAIDDETVAGGLYAVARAIDRLADTIATGQRQPRRD